MSSGTHHFHMSSARDRRVSNKHLTINSSFLNLLLSRSIDVADGGFDFEEDVARMQAFFKDSSIYLIVIAHNYLSKTMKTYFGYHANVRIHIECV